MLVGLRDARLYRATHGTFESYCAEKWKMTKGRVYQLIGATEVMSTVVDKSQITTESQARELARVEPARREEVTRKADIATGGKITVAAIKLP
jgi:UDP-N-acetylmuramoylalanine-D-glutamate ligase